MRVLFVGNSYTSFNGLPMVVEALSSSKVSPVRLEVGMHAPGGQTWEGHDADPELEEKLAEGWDYVVLQDQSVQAFVTRGVKNALLSLDEKVRTAGAQSVLYMTWARSRDEAGPLAVFEQNLALTRYYQEAGEAIDALVAPVGRAWEIALRDPTRTLHRADGSHPTELGSYLAACVLFQTLTGASVVGIGTGGLEIAASDAEVLQNVAEETRRARTWPTAPLLGHWPLSGEGVGNDFLASHTIEVGDFSSNEGRVGTSFSSGGFGAIPYFSGLRAPNITVAVWAHRDDWTEPTPHPSLAETLVGRYQAYELYQRGTVLFAEVFAGNTSKTEALSFDVSSLSPGWHHIALTYDGSMYRLWVDKSEVAGSAASGALRYSDSSAIPDFGKFGGIAVAGAPNADGTVAVGMVSAFRGALADLRLYQVALNSEGLGSL